MADFKKIRRDIESMIEAGRSDKDIDAYIKEQGVTLKQVQRNMPFYEDMARSAGSGVVEGLVAVPKLLTLGAEKAGPATAEGAKALRSLMQGATLGVENYDPATNAGLYTKAGTAGAAAAVVPGQSLMKTPMALAGLMSAGAVGGLAGEGAAQMFPGHPDAARFAGNVVGGQVGNLPRLAMSNSAMARQVRDATTAMRPEDWMEALRTSQLAKSLGITLSGPQAIGKQAPSLLQKQLIVEQNPRSAGTMADFYRNTPAQTEAAVRAQLDQIGQPYTDPALLGRNVQQQAEQQIRNAEKARTAATRPLYERAGTDALPVEEAQGFLRQIDALKAADKTGAFAPQLNYLKRLLTAEPGTPGRPGQRAAIMKPGQIKPIYKDVPAVQATPDKPIQDVENLSRATRVMGERIELPPFAAEAVDKETAATILAVTDRIKESMSRNSPAYRDAQAAYRNLSPGVVALQKGAMGDIAGTAHPGTQFQRLIDEQLSTPTTVQSVAQGLRRPPIIGNADIPGREELYASLLRHGVGEKFDDAQKALLGGGEEYWGARFARNMQRTPQLDANMKAALAELPNGKSVVSGMENLLRVLEATGNRIPVGSRTAFNMRNYEDMTSGVLKDTLRRPTDLGLRSLMQAWDNMNTRKWAQLFTDPDSVRKIRKLAMTKPGSEAAQALVTSILSSVKDEPQEEAFQ